MNFYLNINMDDNPTEWFQSKILELEDDLKKQEVLLELKSVVMNSENSVLYGIAQQVSLHQVFKHLNKSDKNDIEVICIIIYELLKQLTPQELLKKYSDEIDDTLKHNSNDVKKIGLKLLEKSITDETIEYLIKSHILLFINVIECLAISERSTAQCAISALIKLGSNSKGLETLYSELLCQKLQKVMSKNDISRFRVYEIVVGVSEISSEHLSASTFLLKYLVSDVYSSDLLKQLNAFEILSNLAKTNHGLNYLVECNVVQKLVNKLLYINEEPLSYMLLPGLIEFFGNICIQQPESFVKEYPQVMSLLFNSLNTDDQIVIGVIIITVGKLGSTCSGRNVLIQFPEQMNGFFKKCSEFLSTKSDITISVLKTFGELLKNIEGNSECNEVTESWLNAMDYDAFNNITSLAKFPFPEFKLAALSFLLSITTHQWGVVKLCNSPGMIEFLLDRSSEIDKDCKQMKYDIICNIVQCKNVEQFLVPEVLQSLMEFVQEGPFHVPLEVELSTEGAT